MKTTTLFLTVICLFNTFAMADNFSTADRTSYVVTLNLDLTEDQVALCSERICDLSGDRNSIECSVSARFKIVIANLSNSSVNKVRNLNVTNTACVKSIRQKRSDFEVRPRVGLSN